MAKRKRQNEGSIMNTISPGPQGLYDPAYEHDACGVGFIVEDRKSVV